MKQKNIILACTVLLALLGCTFSVCAETLSPFESRHSGCKNTRALDDEVASFDKWELRCFHDYEYNVDMLEVTWYNVYANCCPEELSCSLRIEEDTLIFDLVDKDGMCDCMCLYDVTSKFEGIKPGTYNVIFRNGNYEYYSESDVEIGGISKLIGPNADDGSLIFPSGVDRSRCLADDYERSETRTDPYSLPNQWGIGYENGILELTWYNYLANCCTSYKIKLEREEDTLIYNIDEYGPLCSCICPYNVSSTFEGVPPGHYRMVFCAFGRERYSQEIDITEGMNLKLGTQGVDAIMSETDMFSLRGDGILLARSGSSLKVEIYDASGVLFGRVEGTGEIEIMIDTLPAGIYVAKGVSGDRTDSIRFIR